MKKIVAFILIVGFLAVDFLFFHDIQKPGEVITTAQYMTGALSLIVLAIAGRALISKERHEQ
jgi:hypothetical protein